MKRLGYKIGLGFFVLIFINVLLAGFAIYHISQLSHPIDRILKEKYQNVSAADNMTQALKQQEYARTALIDEQLDPSLIQKFHTYKNEFLNWHQRAIEGVALPSEPVILNNIMQTFRLYLSKTDTFRLLIANQSSTRFLKSFQATEIRPLIIKLESLCTDLRTVNQEAIAKADSQAKQVSHRATWIIIVISIIAVAISIAVSVRFAKHILQPIQQTTNTVRKISRGQLNQKIDITTDDEIAELGREFNQMTERLHAYEKMNIQQILAEKRKSEAIVSGIPAAIIVTDEAQRLSLMNKRARTVLNVTGNNWQGKRIKEVFEDEQLVRLFSTEEQQISGGQDSQRKLISLTREGQNHYYLVKQINISGDNQTNLGIVTLLQDVTRFKHLDQLKSEFIAAVSHEFKTPLTSMNMVIDILLREVRGKINEDQKELLADAKQDCLRMRMFVKDLLDLSRLESGKLPLKFEPVKIDQLIENALQPLRRSLEQKCIQLHIDINAEIPEFEADLHQLSRVITNLAENALEHSTDAGQIAIKVAQKNARMQICIADNGKGIPEDAIDFIFDKFVQVQNFKEAEEGNIGLGLAIAREIVQAHQGEIWVESQVGKGSRFYFTVPLTQNKEFVWES